LGPKTVPGHWGMVRAASHTASRSSSKSSATLD
jgi:hypothetical protein